MIFHSLFLEILIFALTHSQSFREWQTTQSRRKFYRQTVKSQDWFTEILRLIDISRLKRSTLCIQIQIISPTKSTLIRFVYTSGFRFGKWLIANPYYCNLQLREHDKELSFFDGLFELKIDFPPSYPFKEEITSSGYMNTRCPAWCDRVLMNEFAHNLLHDVSSQVIYK